jgi:hypothetical protein
MRFSNLTLCVAALLGSSAFAQEIETTTVDAEMKAEELRAKVLANEEAARSNREKKRKEILDSLPTSPTTGAVTVKDGAGQAEANALAGTAASRVAALIAERISAAAKAAEAGPAGSSSAQTPCPELPNLDSDAVVVDAHVVPVLLLSGSESASFGHWDQFRFRACKVARDYAAAATEVNAASVPLQRLLPRQAGGSIAGVGTAISAAVKLAQLGIPDWEIASLQTSFSNRPVLLDVASAYREVEANSVTRPIYWQGAVSRLGGSAPVFAALDKLQTLNQAAEMTSKALAEAIAQGQKLLEEKKPKAGLEEAVKLAVDAKLALDRVVASHAALLKDLYGGDAASPLPIALVVNEASSARLLGTRGLVASINVDSQGGTSASRKALWNVFDPTPPLFVTGTVGISYAAVRPSDQQLLGSGSYRCSTGPVKLRYVPGIVNSGGTMSCVVARHR